jgi:hypothetical protein
MISASGGVKKVNLPPKALKAMSRTSFALRTGWVDQPEALVKEAAGEAGSIFSGTVFVGVMPFVPGRLRITLFTACEVASPPTSQHETLNTEPAPVAVVTSVLVSFDVESAVPLYAEV